MLDQDPIIVAEASDDESREQRERFLANYKCLQESEGGGSGARKRVLVVGDGNLSFSLALARLFPNIELVATTLDSRAVLEERYASGEVVRELEALGAEVRDEVDGTALGAALGASFRADLIVFNFPHHPGKGYIQRNRALLLGFLESSAQHLQPGGEVRVALAKGQGGTPVDVPRKWADHWQLSAQGARAGLLLAGVHPFAAPPRYHPAGYKSMNKRFGQEEALEHVLVAEAALRARGLRALYPPSFAFDLSFWVTDAFLDAHFLALALGTDGVAGARLEGEVRREELPVRPAKHSSKHTLPPRFLRAKTFRIQYRSDQRAVSEEEARRLHALLRHQVFRRLDAHPRRFT